MPKLYYKVVKEIPSGLRSVNISATIIYEVGKWVLPKILWSKLFVFADYSDAKSFIREKLLESNQWRIYSCQVQNPSKIRHIVSSFDYGLTKFWKLHKNKKKISHLGGVYPAPYGTVICDAVKLIERVN